VSADKKAPRPSGAFSYFLVLVDFVMRSSSFSNSAVSSSSFDLDGGGLRKGITSDISLSLDARPRCASFSRAIAAFLRRRFFAGFESVIIIFKSGSALTNGLRPHWIF
jgi:hypothetical protein